MNCSLVSIAAECRLTSPLAIVILCSRAAFFLADPFNQAHSLTQTLDIEQRRGVGTKVVSGRTGIVGPTRRDHHPLTIWPLDQQIWIDPALDVDDFDYLA